MSTLLSHVVGKERRTVEPNLDVREIGIHCVYDVDRIIERLGDRPGN